jgi:radical SAM protein with 4Fe4S-binding SPASM domain
MRANLDQLAEVAALITRAGASIWEVFFLVGVGRGTDVEPVTPDEHEDVCHFLYDVAQRDLVVRTVEAPFFRRVSAQRAGGAPAPASPRYETLTGRLGELLGPPTRQIRPGTAATRDGKGIVFVAHDGEVFPAGFLPLALGNIRDQPLCAVYRDNPVLRAIRAARFTGRCGYCEYADLCGGSRARAFAATGDPLGEDPACPYQPATQTP